MSVHFESGYTQDDYARFLWDKLSGTVTATSSASGFDAANADAVDTASWWQPNTSSGTWTIAYASAQNVDSVGIAAHTLSGVLVTIQAEISSVWTTVLSFTPSDNSAILAIFDTVSATGIRITIAAQERIGVVYSGVALKMPLHGYAKIGLFDLNRQASLTSYISEGGQLLGRFIQRRGLQASFTYEYLAEDWYRTNFDPFAVSAQTEPFFVAARPSGYPTDCAYAWCDATITPQRMGVANFLSVSFTAQGHADAA